MPREQPCLLLVDAVDPDSAEFADLFQLYNYRVLTTPDAAGALGIIQSTDIDGLIVSLEVAGGGFEVSQILLAASGNPGLPLAFVTQSPTDEALLMEAQFYGGLFVIAKPYRHSELLAQVSSMVRIKMLQDELQDRMCELDRLASFDCLTGIYNRRMFFQRLGEELARSRRGGLQLGILYADIDYFKQVNDTYGHHVGDAVLQQVTAAMRLGLRISDVLGRIGGEEFAVILPSTGTDATQMIAERLRQQVQKQPCSYGSWQVPVTISVGAVAVMDTRDWSEDKLINMADAALYQAKHLGRNRCVFQDLHNVTPQPAGAPAG
jgi:diguanylate cyclase (GGDEF)-like protein